MCSPTVTDVMLTIMLVFLTTANTSSLQIEPSISACNSISDVRVKDSHGIFEVPAGSGLTGGIDAADAYIPIRIHIFANQSSSKLKSVLDWVTWQRHSANSTLQTWCRHTGINLTDIKIKVYVPSSVSATNLGNIMNMSSPHLLDTITVSDNGWKKLGRLTVSMYGNNSTDHCSNEVNHIFINATYRIVHLVYDTSCPASYGNKCLYGHLHFVCKGNLHQGDHLQFTYKPTTERERVIIKLFKMNVDLVFESNCSLCNYNFTLQEDGEYAFEIERTNSELFSGVFTYKLNYPGCKNVTTFLHDWLLHIDPRNINILYTDIRTMPILYGRYEYLILSRNTLTLMRRIEIITKEDDHVWGYLAAAFGAVLRKEDIHASCEEINRGVINDTMVALRQGEKLRCLMYNSPNPFGENFKRRLINISFNGSTTELYVPSIKVPGPNQTLYCNDTKLCVWKTTLSNTTLSETKDIIPTASSGTLPNLSWLYTSPTKWYTKTINSNINTVVVPSLLATTNLHVTKSSEKSITSDTRSSFASTGATAKSIVMPSISLSCFDPNKSCKKKTSTADEMKIIFGLKDDVSSLSHKDIEQWMWINVRRTLKDVCIMKQSVKLTVVIGNLIELNQDLISVQYQMRNHQLYLKNHLVCSMLIVGEYDCDKEEENHCPIPKSALKTWHIVSFSTGGVIIVISIILGFILCRY